MATRNQASYKIEAWQISPIDTNRSKKLGECADEDCRYPVLSVLDKPNLAMPTCKHRTERGMISVKVKL